MLELTESTDNIKYLIPLDKLDLTYLNLPTTRSKIIQPLWSCKPEKTYQEYEFVIGSDSFDDDKNTVTNEIDEKHSETKTKDESFDMKLYLRLVRAVLETHPNVFEELDNQLIQITTVQGNTVKVPSDNFLGLSEVRGHIQCRVCRELVTDREAHLMTIKHLKMLATPVLDENCVRQLDELWSYCVICNTIIGDASFHVQCSDEHQDLVKQAMQHDRTTNNTGDYQTILEKIPSGSLHKTNANKPSTTIDKNVFKPFGSIDKNVNKPSGSIDKNVNKPSGSIDKNVNKPSGSIDRNVFKPFGSIDKNVNKPSGSIDKNVNKPSGSFHKTNENKPPGSIHNNDSNTKTKNYRNNWKKYVLETCTDNQRVYCKVCDTFVPNNDYNITTHVTGNRHNSNLSVYNKSKSKTDKKQTNIDPKPSSSKNKTNYYCQICKLDMHVNNKNSHIKGNQHKNSLESHKLKGTINQETIQIVDKNKVATTKSDLDIKLESRSKDSGNNQTNILREGRRDNQTNIFREEPRDNQTNIFGDGGSNNRNVPANISTAISATNSDVKPKKRKCRTRNRSRYNCIECNMEMAWLAKEHHKDSLLHKQSLLLKNLVQVGSNSSNHSNIVKERPRDNQTNILGEEPSNNQINIFREGPIDNQKKILTEGPGANPKNISREGSRDDQTNILREGPRDNQTNIFREGPIDNQKKILREGPGDNPKNISREGSRDDQTNILREGPRDNQANLFIEGPRDNQTNIFGEGGSNNRNVPANISTAISATNSDVKPKKIKCRTRNRNRYNCIEYNMKMDSYLKEYHIFNMDSLLHKQSLMLKNLVQVGSNSSNHSNLVKEGPIDNQTHIFGEKPSDNQINIFREGPIDNQKKILTEGPGANPKNISREGSRDDQTNILREGPRDNQTNILREGPRDNQTNILREAPRDNQTNIFRHEPRDNQTNIFGDGGSNNRNVPANISTAISATNSDVKPKKIKCRTRNRNNCIEYNMKMDSYLKEYHIFNMDSLLHKQSLMFKNLVKVGSNSSNHSNIVKEGPKGNQTNIFREGPIDNQKKILREGPGDNPKNISREGSRDDQTNILREGPRDNQANILREGSRNDQINILREGPRDNQTHIFRERPSDNQANILREGPRDNPTNISREGSRDDQTNIFRERPSDNQANILREGARDNPTNISREGSRDDQTNIFRERPSDIHTNIIKQKPIETRTRGFENMIDPSDNPGISSTTTSNVFSTKNIPTKSEHNAIPFKNSSLCVKNSRGNRNMMDIFSHPNLYRCHECMISLPMDEFIINNHLKSYDHFCKIQTMRNNMLKLQSGLDFPCNNESYKNYLDTFLEYEIVDRERYHKQFKDSNNACIVCRVTFSDEEDFNNHFGNIHIGNFEVYIKNNNLSDLNMYGFIHHYYCKRCSVKISKYELIKHMDTYHSNTVSNSNQTVDKTNSCIII